MEPIQENKQSLEQMPPVSQGGVEPRLTVKEAIGECLGKYATFTGRSRRSEYWWFGLFVLILTLIPSGLAIATEGILGKTENAFCIVLLMGVASFGVVLWTIIPSLAVQTRRLHDVGRSGWWIVWDILVLAAYSVTEIVVLGDAAQVSSIHNLQQAFNVSTTGWIVMLLIYLVQIGLSLAILVFSLQDSHRGENKYGPSPKYP
jgi:uncharacterized membrane protein YhaH (DUF805 family)